MPDREPIRITEVLNYTHEPWYTDWVLKVGKKQANKISNDAMRLGTTVDDAIKGKTVSVHKNDKEFFNNCISAYKKWNRIYKPDSVVPMGRMNIHIKEKDLFITGEPDLLVNGNTIVDIKCSRAISLKQWIQVNMYSLLNMLCTDQPVMDIAILRLDKNTGSYEYVVKPYSQVLSDVWYGLAGYYVLSNKENENDGDEL